jgi:ribonucleotide reductase beta subunit family protein with ferritin-like domain
MTLNELMLKQNFISKVMLKDGDKELSRELKVKIVGMRVKMAKFRKEFDEDVQEFVKNLKPEGFDELYMKEDKSPEEQAQFDEWNKKLNEEYAMYVNKRGLDEIDYEVSLTDDELNELIDINAGNDVEINGTELSAPDFLEILYSLFVA